MQEMAAVGRAACAIVRLWSKTHSVSAGAQRYNDREGRGTRRSRRKTSVSDPRHRVGVGAKERSKCGYRLATRSGGIANCGGYALASTPRTSKFGLILC